jgi:predicted PurR-regulated permease PerM
MPQRRSLVFLAVALAGLLPFLLQVAWPFITSFILASILAIVMSPVKEWLNRRTRRPALATSLTTFATLLVVGGATAFAGYTIYKELASAYESIGRRSLEEGGWPALVTHTADRVVDAMATRIPVDKEAIRTELTDRMKSAGGYLLNNVAAAIGGATDSVITCILVAVFLFYLLRYGRAWIDQLALLTPLDPRTTAGILRTVHDSVVANVNGMVAAAVGQGVCLWLGFLVAGVRAPALWGAVGGLASIVPVIGAPLVWVPVVAGFLLMGSYWKALLLLLWCALVVGSVDNVLRPLVVGARAEQQHPVLIALAAIGGTYAFGPMGLLLGPLVIALAAALVKEIRRLIPSSAAEVDAAGERATPPAKGLDKCSV